jgi:hypothetical protein
MSMAQFELTLKNDKVKSYQWIALINLLLNAAVFALLSFYEAYRAVAIASIGALALYALLRWYVSEKQGARHFFDEFAFFIPAICWFGMNNYLFMILLILMGFLFRFSMQPIRFVFTAQKVIKTNFPKKEFEWNAFSNVILKDNILTLDLRNNKLIQAEIEKPQELKEDQFNVFVRDQMNKQPAASLS